MTCWLADWVRLEEAMLDMQPDEAMEMAKKQRITKVGW